MKIGQVPLKNAYGIASLLSNEQNVNQILCLHTKNINYVFDFIYIYV